MSSPNFSPPLDLPQDLDKHPPALSLGHLPQDRGRVPMALEAQGSEFVLMITARANGRAGPVRVGDRLRLWIERTDGRVEVTGIAEAAIGNDPELFAMRAGLPFPRCFHRHLANTRARRFPAASPGRRPRSGQRSTVACGNRAGSPFGPMPPSPLQTAQGTDRPISR